MEEKPPGDMTIPKYIGLLVAVVAAVCLCVVLLKQPATNERVERDSTDSTRIETSRYTDSLQKEDSANLVFSLPNK